jgi:hypothetical protein
VLWAEEGEIVVLDWWTRRGDEEVLGLLRRLAADVENGHLYERYKVEPLGVDGRYVIDLPVYGVCVVMEIRSDRVELLSILNDHPSEDDFELP